MKKLIHLAGLFSNEGTNNIKELDAIIHELLSSV